MKRFTLFSGSALLAAFVLPQAQAIDVVVVDPAATPKIRPFAVYHNSLAG